jgi:hypothetical protein
LYGYAKSQRENISAKELQALKKMASHLFAFDAAELASALVAQELLEVDDEDDEE